MGKMGKGKSIGLKVDKKCQKEICSPKVKKLMKTKVRRLDTTNRAIAKMFCGGFSLFKRLVVGCLQ